MTNVRADMGGYRAEQPAKESGSGVLSLFAGSSMEELSPPVRDQLLDTLDADDVRRILFLSSPPEGQPSSASNSTSLSPGGGPEGNNFDLSKSFVAPQGMKYAPGPGGGGHLVAKESFSKFPPGPTPRIRLPPNPFTSPPGVKKPLQPVNSNLSAANAAMQNNTTGAINSQGVAAPVAPPSRTDAQFVGNLFSAAGIDLQDLSPTVSEAVPPTIDFSKTGNFNRGQFLQDLQPMRTAVYGENAMITMNDGTKGFHIYALQTNPKNSILHESKRTVERTVEGTKLQCNRFDISRIGGKGSGIHVSAAPTVNQDKVNSNQALPAKEFFQATTREGVNFYVDLRADPNFGLTMDQQIARDSEARSKGEQVLTKEDKDDYFCKAGGLWGVSEHRTIEWSEDGNETVQGEQGHTYREANFKDDDGQVHRCVQMKIRDMPDNTMADGDKVVKIFQEMDAVAMKTGVDPNKVVIHCAGGLGRSPLLCALRAVWNTAKAAHAGGVSCCCNWDRANEMMVDGKVNHAYTARNAFCEAVNARSSVGQDAKQFAKMADAVQSIAVHFA
ncbi:MAG: hypothetical protein LBP65_00685 [Puniceicoccales bacterium]|nr:hypothetical protein [Puniceicoccales bacterium]